MDTSTPLLRCAVVGRGRLGPALAAALEEAGHQVVGPLGREDVPAGVDVVLLAVPDAEIAAAAANVPSGPLVGHCSGATGLDVLGDRDGFLLHPLMTVTGADTRLAGAGCAIDGTTKAALAVARTLAGSLRLQPVEIADGDRTAYHAAASIASNFLVTLEAAAEQLAATTGMDRALLGPLVRATVENWLALGPERALTGPIARGDEETVERQRAAVAERAPELLDLFDALAEATRRLASAKAPA
jgi:predicted short-subunit dehydrogenase-like oxidoreductase (DUF2520 family)